MIETALLLSVLTLPQDPPPKPDSRPATEMGWTGVLDEETFARLHELKQGKAPLLRGKDIQVSVPKNGEGYTAKAYLSLPKQKPLGAVLVIHEWWGLNSHIKHWADRLTTEGYAALAIDLYEGTVATDRDGARAAMQAVDPAKAIQTLRAAHAFLQTDSRVKAQRTASMGWCFGGGWSLKLAMAEPELDAAVIYYGRLVSDARQLEAIRAPVMGVFGNQDRGIPPKAVDAFAAGMKEAGRKLELRRYDANHAFANPSSARYDQKKASLAWGQVRKFLSEHLRPKPATSSFPVGHRKVHYEIPAGWQHKPGSSMRKASYAIGAEGECYVVVLNGNGGGVAANINRWRSQLGQGNMTAEAIARLPRWKACERDAIVVQIDGDFGERKGVQMRGLILTLDRATVFVRMVGPKAEVEAAAGAFEQFCKSFRF